MKRIALYHDYLNQYGGGERVLEVLRELFPEADVFTLFYDRKQLPQFQRWKIKVSPAQYLPFITKKHQIYFWLFPFLVQSFNFRNYDLVISSTHAWGNGIRKQNAKMLVYCHTPIRYFWDLYEVYRQNKWIPFFARWSMPLVKDLIRGWDKKGAGKADMIIANSQEVKERISNNYEREALCIYPPVKTKFFGSNGDLEKESYYLVVCRLKAYKRVDVIIEAFNQLKKPLRIVGDGEEEVRLKKIAGSSVSFFKRITDHELRDLYLKAKGYVYMAHEDFGMSLVEAQAAGLPVMAFNKGGAREIVIPDETGILFDEQTPEALIRAVKASESREWDSHRIQKNAERFGVKRFKESILNIVADL